MIVDKISQRDTLTIVMSSFIRDLKITEPNITEWREGAGGMLYRRAYLLPGMTLEEAERIVAQPESKPPVWIEVRDSSGPWCPSGEVGYRTVANF